MTGASRRSATMSQLGKRLAGTRGRSPVSFWTLSALVVAVLAGLPLAAVLTLSLFPEENIWPHLAGTVLPGYLVTTTTLMLGVGTGAILIGVGSAWLVTMCRFPGRRLLAWALLLPFAVPAYVIAYVYTDLLEYAGVVQSTLRTWFGWSSSSQYWFPEIRSLGGAVGMMSLVMYPYVYLLARAAFLEQSVTSLDAARILGHGPWSSFVRVSLPMARPSIVVGLALVLMETLNDYGTVDYFAVRTLTTGIYDVWLGMGNLGGAAQIAAVMLLFVALLLTGEQVARKRQRQYAQGRRFQRLPVYRLRGWKSHLAWAVCTFPVAAGFAVPATVLGVYALERFDAAWTDRFREYAMNSLLLSAGAGICAVVIGVILAYGKRLRASRVVSTLTRFASLGYAMPGAVLAIGVIIPLAALDNALDAFAREHWGYSTGLVLSGSIFALIFAYVVRFLAVAFGGIESSLARVTPSMDMASRSLGTSAGRTLARIHLPLIRGGVLTAALIVFVDTMKELPATLILRPFNFDTLATYVYQFASDEMLEECALAALMIVVAGLVPVTILNRTIADSRKAARPIH